MDAWHRSFRRSAANSLGGKSSLISMPHREVTADEDNDKRGVGVENEADLPTEPFQCPQEKAAFVRHLSGGQSS